ncbi:MAG TPA: diadenylate cyclase [Blastocatellia bacterium]|nr:diadenylate cyclase [Blastocatellia bacterium]
MFETIWARTDARCKAILEPTLELAIEIAREGREGHRIGTIFMVGDAANVLARSRSLILDPLAGHPESARSITDANLRGTLKELAQLDGAFVISDEGVVVSACRYLDATAVGIELPLGLGSRHFAAASISKVTESVGIVVSESALVRVFDDGELIAEVLPELWLLSRYSVQLPAPFSEEHVRDLAILVSADKGNSSNETQESSAPISQ